MLSQKIDLMVYGRDHAPILAVEVKNGPNLTAELATAYRQDVIPYLESPSTPYLLLLSQDRGYLWRGDAPLDARPAAEFSVREYLRPYLLDPESDQWVSGSQIEIAVFSWLLDLVNARPREQGRAQWPEALAEVVPLIRKGDVVMESNE